MRYLIIILCVSNILFLTTCSNSDPEEAVAQLLFEDNFDGSVIDGSKWEKCPEWERQGASQWENDNSYVENGNLVLKITPHDTKENWYSQEQYDQKAGLKGHMVTLKRDLSFRYATEPGVLSG